MRVVLLLVLALLTSGCLAPGKRDPTRYPWDRRNLASAAHPPIVARGAIAPLPEPQRQAMPPNGNNCVIQMETGSSTGIVVGGKAPALACSGTISAPPPPLLPLPPAPPRPPRG